MGGFSLHTDVVVRANQRNKRERLCRYISRPARSEQRLSLTSGGKVRYQLKTPYNDGTTHVVFAPNSAQRHRVNRRYPDAVGSMPGQGIG